MDTFLTIKNPGTGIYREKGSRFLGYSFPVQSESEIKNILTDFKKKYYDATHHCFAWRIGFENPQYRINDDGEPSGTAGLPILGQIQSKNLFDIFILVIRYYGGTKLGVSGLIQAYKTAAFESIISTEIVEKTINSQYVIEFSFENLNAVMKILKEFKPKIHSQDFNLQCVIKFEIRKSRSEMLEDKLRMIPLNII
jgi:uncharacterized YigZ family protein